MAGRERSLYMRDVASPKLLAKSYHWRLIPRPCFIRTGQSSFHAQQPVTAPVTKASSAGLIFTVLGKLIEYILRKKLFEYAAVMPDLSIGPDDGTFVPRWHKTQCAQLQPVNI